MMMIYIHEHYAEKISGILHWNYEVQVYVGGDWLIMQKQSGVDTTSE